MARAPRLVLSVVALLAASQASAQAQQTQAQQAQPKVDLVIALDTSGSMRGLIEATRRELWNAVRLLGRAQPQPIVRVGLVTFGSNRAGERTGWVRRELDLTSDLDAVATRLFALPIGGSHEYVARAVQTATRELTWDQDPSTLKLLFVAGNEGATQDPVVALAGALGEARRRGIVVNSIFCGSPSARDAGGWRSVASWGAGQFSAIDHTTRVAMRVTPYDRELGRLSRELSSTYVAFGSDGGRRARQQAAADARAEADGPAAAAERAAAKATAAYRNGDWDAVDALLERRGRGAGGTGTATAAAPPLPDAIVAEAREKADRRRHVQAQINELAARRDAYLAQPVAQPVGAVVAASAPATATPAPATAPTAPAQPVMATTTPLAKAPMRAATRESWAPPPPARAAKPAPTTTTTGMDEALSGTLRRQAAARGFTLPTAPLAK